MKIDLLQIKKFVIGGGSATLIHYLSMAILIYFDVKPIYATSIGALIGALVNYILQYYYTFESKNSHLKAISSYIISVSFGFIANIILFALFHQKLLLGVIVSQLITTAIITILNYILYKYFVFKPKESN